MAGKKKSITKKDKYKAQFLKTEQNKARNIAKMKKLNPNYPDKKVRQDDK